MIHIGETYKMETIICGETGILFVVLPKSEEILVNIRKSEIGG
jgi:hypothetical protein